MGSLRISIRLFPFSDDAWLQALAFVFHSAFKRIFFSERFSFLTHAGKVKPINGPRWEIPWHSDTSHSGTRRSARVLFFVIQRTIPWMTPIT
jgi:hypothetical protein